MTYEQLNARADELEDILDNSNEECLPEVEQELCEIYDKLAKMFGPV